MTVSKQLIDNVEKIKTTLNEISVYNLDVKTAIELYYELAKKVNEVINELSRFEGVVSDEVIKQNKKLIYLLGEGLKVQVGLKIDELIKDGTIQDLINNKIFNELNNKIDTFKQEVNEQFNTINHKTINYINIEQFKTDSNSWDNALDLSLKYCEDNNIKKIILPNKQMVFNENHIIKNNRKLWDLEIEGVGQSIDNYGTEMKFIGNGLFIDVDFTLPNIGFWRGIKFKNISFVGNNKLNDLIRFVFNQQSTFENCMFQNCNKSVIVTGNTHYTMFKNCRFMVNNIGVYSPNANDDYYVSGEANSCYFDNCFFTYCTNPVKQSDNSTSWLFTNCDFEGYNGTIILNSHNTFNNVRLERNNMGVYLELNEFNTIQCDIHGSGGGIACNPGIKINGNGNEIILTGKGYKAIEFRSINLYNKIDLKNWECLESYTVLDKVTNKTEFKGFNYPLLNVGLSNFTSYGGITFNIETNNIVKNGEGKLYYQINSKTGLLYLTLKQKGVAGGGFNLVCNGKSVDIINTFPSSTDETITIYQFNLNKGSINELSFEITGDSGSTINITDFKMSEYLSSKLF